MAIRRTNALALLGTAAALILSGAPPAGAAPAPPVPAGVGKPTPAAAELDGGVRFLIQRYGIGAAEGQRRMVLQDRVTRLQDALDTRFGRGYGGLWLDQAGGGVATVGVRPGQAAAVAAMAAAEGVAAVRTVPVARSLADLDRARTEVEKAGQRVTGTSVRTNQLVVPAATSLQQRFPGLLRVERIPTPVPAAACADLGSWFCSPPLRGGVGLSSPVTGGGVSYCTAGFNARSRSDGKRFLMTAAHCSTGNVHQTRFADGGVHNVGREWQARLDASTDAMIVTVDNPDPVKGWNPKPWVLVTDTYQENYTVSGDGGSYDGLVVCAAARTYGTQCGEVIHADYPGALGVQHAAVVYGGCVVEADSGGPVIKNHVAYGIVHATGQTDCSYWWYTGIRNAENQLRVDVTTTSAP